MNHHLIWLVFLRKRAVKSRVYTGKELVTMAYELMELGKKTRQRKCNDGIAKGYRGKFAYYSCQCVEPSWQKKFILKLLMI